MSLPDYSFLPAPLWLITVLHLLTLALHFAAMNFLVGGLIIVLFGGFADRWQNRTVCRFVSLFPVAAAATVTLGIAPLLFLQLVFSRQIYAAAIVSGWFWLAVVLAVMAGYYLLYIASLRGDGKSQRWLMLGALGAFLYVSLVYSSVFSMTERPELVHRLYTEVQSGLAWNPVPGDYVLRWFHMILGAVTVGGFFVGALGKDDPEAFNAGRLFFLWGMVAASLAGFAYLGSLGSYMVPFMRTPGIWSLSIAIVLSLGSLHFFFKRRILPSGVMLFSSLLGMVIGRHYLRLVKLQNQFDPASLRVVPQWSPFALFAICLAVAAIAIYYMTRAFLGGDGKVELGDSQHKIP
jgi:hypothetical protein